MTTIKVTAEHIAEGKRGWGVGDTSPIELAIKEIYPTVPVDVHTNWVHVCGTDEGCLEADLPGEAEEFIYAFADGDPVGPFEFTVQWRAAPDDEGDEGEPGVPMSAPTETPAAAAEAGQPSAARAFARRHLPVSVRRASVRALPMLETPRGTRGVPRRQLRARGQQ